MIWGGRDHLAQAERALAGVETCLRGGRLDALPKQIATMERAMSGLRSANLDRTAANRLTSLRMRAGQVGELLQAVMAGMRDARTSMTTQPGFSSYDALGRVGQVGEAHSTFERRR